MAMIVAVRRMVCKQTRNIPTGCFLLNHVAGAGIAPATSSLWGLCATVTLARDVIVHENASHYTFCIVIVKSVI